jgi:hypothetical protein
LIVVAGRVWIMLVVDGRSGIGDDGGKRLEIPLKGKRRSLKWKGLGV